MAKIVTIIGARPQFIKASVVSRQLTIAGIQEIIVHTGQHFDFNMSEVFFKEMEIPEPAYNLDIHGLPHGAMTGRMIEGIEKIILVEKPDAVMVYGDTNSTLAGAIAARKQNIKLVHVEAGLRSFNMAMPEEVNRILTDRISDILFCPTETSVINLKNEGFDHISCAIEQCGDVMYDSALFFSKVAQTKSAILVDLGLTKGSYILCTLHRQENTDNIDNLNKLIETLNELSKQYQIVLPIHPRTRNILDTHAIKLHFNPIDPVGYMDMIQLLNHCSMVITDSGGLQKESYFFDKYCITIRNETEWVELVDCGYNFLAGTNKNRIIELVNKIGSKQIRSKKELYGKGNASVIIAQKLTEYLK